MSWETVIGLEVHVQLATASKMFTAAANAFGETPNSLVDPVTLGLPGALPVPNAEAVRLGVLASLALECTVHEVSIFARKHYFYPDLPKGYQISQFDKPLATGGRVLCESPERGPITVGVTRLHLEEDAGKSLHDRIPGKTGIDLNRAGVPLAEIVSEPDLRSSGEARAYLTALRQLLIYAGASDCSMEKGTLRVDANISVRKSGAPFGTRCEVKNLNSFANVERAIEVERVRQIGIIEGGGRIIQSTLLFDANAGEVRVLRSKEDSHDYRYFPDPDIPPLVLSDAWVAEQRGALSELPDAKRQRFQSVYGLPAYHAATLVGERAIADYFESVVSAGAEPKAAADWVLESALTSWNETGEFAVPANRLAAVIGIVADGTVSKQAAKQVYAEMLTSGEDPKAIATRLGLVQVRDTGAIAAWVDEVIAASPREVERFKGGDAKLIGFFVGQVMKKSGGKADPKAIQPLIMEKLK